MNRKIVIDVVALIAYFIAANPAFTGISAHEWIGCGLLLVLVVHSVQHYDQVIDAFKGSAKGKLLKRLNVIVDILVLILFMVVTVSGLGVSGSVLPAFGTYADGYFVWDPLHSISAKALLALLIVHLVLHGDWILGLFKKGKKNGKNED